MVSRQNADIADTLHLRDWLSIYGVQIANTTEPSVCGRPRRRVLTSNYFDHLFY